MHITLNDIGKRFKTEWIFKNVKFEFSAGNNCAILGANGSGKSTLLQIISASISPTAGTVNYRIGDSAIDVEQLFSHLSFASPYLELPEEFTLTEMINFH